MDRTNSPKNAALSHQVTMWTIDTWRTLTAGWPQSWVEQDATRFTTHAAYC